MATGLGRAGRLRFVALFVPVVMVIAGCGGGDGHGIRSTPDATTTSSQATTTSDLPGSEGVLPPNIERRLKNSPEPGSAREARGVINLVLTSDAPLACDPSFVTQHYLDASYGGRKGCVDARRSGGAAARVYLKSLRIVGDHATAVVVPSGGPSDGERVTVYLVAKPRPGSVRARDHWTVDALRSNVPVGP
jgi:hypothetical protein